MLRGILQAAGVPLWVDVLAQECSLVYGQVATHYEQALPRLLGDAEEFFKLYDGRYGLAGWLLVDFL